MEAMGKKLEWQTILENLLNQHNNTLIRPRRPAISHHKAPLLSLLELSPVQAAQEERSMQGMRVLSLPWSIPGVCTLIVFFSWLLLLYYDYLFLLLLLL